MSEPDYSGVEDENVPHEEHVAEAIDDQMVRTSDHAAIADVTPKVASNVASASAAYAEAEADAVVTAVNAIDTHLIALEGKVNEILDVLRDAALVPSS